MSTSSSASKAGMMEAGTDFGLSVSPAVRPCRVCGVNASPSKRKDLSPEFDYCDPCRKSAPDTKPTGNDAWPAFEWTEQPVRVVAPSKMEFLLLRSLIVFSTVAVVSLLIWLVEPGRIGDLVVYIPLTAAIFLRGIGWLLEWYNYWNIQIPDLARADRPYAVDIFTTACPGEPTGMIVRTLRAMQAIRLPHKSYLCDEGNDPYLKEVCDSLGVIHVTRTEKKHAKAGNINNALSQSDGEICVVLDPDHEPAPYFLERTLGYFADESVGFVQTIQGYRNQGESFVARGAAEQSYHFYGPYMLGMNGYGTTQAIGANCAFRRSALESIGGHASGLAEDMHTSMRLYSQGWKSVYVPEILTRGLVPSTLGAFFKQQIKWSCGVFDLLFQEYPALRRGFTFWQKLQYLLAPIFFLRGLVSLLEMVVPLICLWRGFVAWHSQVGQILSWFGLILALSTVVRLRAQQWLPEKSERGLHFAGGALAVATWWIYVVGVLCAILRIKVPYIPTPKEDKPSNAWKLSLPNLATAGVLACASVYGVYIDSSPQCLMMASLGLLIAASLLLVSIIAQQKALLQIASLIPELPKRLLNTIARPIGCMYGQFLNQLIQGRAIPASVILILAATSLATWKPNTLTDDTLFTRSELADVGGFYTGLDLSNEPADQLIQTEHRIGKNLDFHFRMVGLTQAWANDGGESLPIQLLRSIRLDGAVPLIHWNPQSADGHVLQAIADGQFDRYLTGDADRLRIFGEPVLLCFADESDNLQMPWAAGSKDFILAWRHVVNLFKARGASNVGWVWQPSRPQSLTGYYPGDGLVDWIGISASRSSSMARFLGPFRAGLLNLKLPVLIEKAEQITDAAKVTSRYSEVRAVLFSADQSSTSVAKSTLKVEPYSSGGAEAPVVASLWCDQHPVRTESHCITGTPGHFELNLDGHPFYIKGIAYNPGHDWRDGETPPSRRDMEKDFQAIHQMGANTIRRYGSSWSDRTMFNVAADNNLKILYGFWFDQDLDYCHSSTKLAEYERNVDSTVLAYRNHPGLLGWSLGNEVWGQLEHSFAQPHLTEVRHAHVLFVEKIARRVRELDPAHPVICVQEFSNDVPGAVSDYAVGAPSFDIVGVNSYYERHINIVKAVTAEFDPSRPYLITEFGPDGYWDTGLTRRTESGGVAEATAMEKSFQYGHRWNDFIERYRGCNVGGLAYCWRDRFEGTDTWFGITDMAGRPKPAYYTLKNVWTHGGSPQLSGLRIDDVRFPKTPVKPGQKFLVQANINTPNDSTGCDYLWSVTGPGFAEYVGVVTPQGDGRSAMIELPKQTGWYRVQLKVTDGTTLDEANLPVLVK